ncbi:preprotein translocase subunit SecG [Spiroplasma endosymbiont of Amphibalanus improvisus]|uniref:preprotein translocase subunit SecG n=1 Tax=Spiroplasma endosymbiont of Amphibalanus improvisus TaxID=3066327 RepID=UPI00313ED2DC
MLTSNQEYIWNVVVYSLEIFSCVVSFVMIIIGLLQNKKSQTGLSALNGGNDELFSNYKERGSDMILSRIMLWSGFLLFLVTIIISIFTNIFL